MRPLRESLGQTLLRGVALVLPIYLAILLLLKAIKSFQAIVRPLARLLPKSIPAEPLFSFFLVVMFCFAVGLALRTPLGQAIRRRIEYMVLQKIPGYEVMRGMTQQLTGNSQETAWRPALAEIEDALVPAFIVEEIDDGRFTVFVPSVPTPLAGAIYILSAERVHPVDVPFAQAVKVITRWGAGSKVLVGEMQGRRTLVNLSE